MKKIPSLFARDYDGDRLVRGELVPGTEWVAADEGVATRKYDGTCCMVRDGNLYKRYDAKKGKTPPADFEPAMDPDPITGHWAGWVPVKGGPEDRWHRETFAASGGMADGTYELIGPKVQANPEGWGFHYFVPHGVDILRGVPRDFAGIRDYLAAHPMEGIVWHHSDGRMVKIKARDFGLPWPVAGR